MDEVTKGRDRMSVRENKSTGNYVWWQKKKILKRQLIHKSLEICYLSYLLRSNTGWWNTYILLNDFKFHIILCENRLLKMNQSCLAPKFDCLINQRTYILSLKRVRYRHICLIDHKSTLGAWKAKQNLFCVCKWQNPSLCVQWE